MKWIKLARVFVELFSCNSSYTQKNNIYIQSARDFRPQTSHTNALKF